MNPKKISFFILCLILIFALPPLSFSEEQTKEAQCHTAPDKVPSLKDNCACNALLDALDLLNIKTTPDEISTLLPLDKDGLTSMYDLLQASKKKGLSPKALKLTYEQLTKTSMPVIVHLTTNHFITLKQIKEDGIISIENNKETFIPKDEFLKNWTGHTLVFNPKTKGIALSNTSLKQIKGSHCTCGGCNAEDCSTGSCGGALSCRTDGCGCNRCAIWCPEVGNQPCGLGPCACSATWQCHTEYNDIVGWQCFGGGQGTGACSGGGSGAWCPPGCNCEAAPYPTRCQCSVGLCYCGSGCAN